ncbi:hypothetical protein B0G77_7054 [Paraburkholderia sp. BL10I2N1]|nr:hypothetical protein B0G77_7054 [Paraburkholderia sp. BL10I2N1]
MSLIRTHLWRSTMFADEIQRRHAMTCEAGFKYAGLSETWLTGL